MSGIFYIMGKSATGKDKVYRQIKEDYPQLEPIVLYTTRPMRERESEGEEYHFIDEAALEAFKEQGKIIEQRTYQTVHGPFWRERTDPRVSVFIRRDQTAALDQKREKAGQPEFQGSMPQIPG